MYKGAKVMKKLLISLCLFVYACGIVDPINEDTRGFSINSVGTTTKKINDSTYLFYIDTIQWQTFERVVGNTHQTKNTIKISWNAYSNKKAYYWYSGIKYEAPIINKSSYSDGGGNSNTMLSVYKQMIHDTVLVMGGYRWNNELHTDHKYFIILAKN